MRHHYRHDNRKSERNQLLELATTMRKNWNDVSLSLVDAKQNGGCNYMWEHPYQLWKGISEGLKFVHDLEVILKVKTVYVDGKFSHYEGK